jgi:hypothetical protein
MENKDNYSFQECQNEEIITEFNNLHHELVDTIIKFCNKYKINIKDVHFGIDHLDCSLPYEKWQAGTDSYFELFSEDCKQNSTNKPYLLSI